jgi:hypothetical protein
VKKRMNDKLALNRETIGRLSGLELSGVLGGGTTTTSETSNPTLTCDTCIGPSCKGNPTTHTATSLCC